MNRLRLNIGPRLVLCFALIIVSMLAGDVIVLWQFHIVQVQAEQLNEYDEELVTVLRVHLDLLNFRDTLETLANTRNAERLRAGTQSMNEVFAEDTQRAKRALLAVHSQNAFDPTILPTLAVVQSVLQTQTGTIMGLAEAKDWNAVQLRLANQIRPLEFSTSTLVERVDREVKTEQAQAAANIRQVQHWIFLVVPTTVVLTLLIAGTLGLVITRSITQPLELLVKGSKALASGDFKHRVPAEGEDELADLGRVFNDTARELQDLYESLQSSEDRLRRVINTIPAHVWSTRPDGSVDFINQRLLESTGLSAEQLLGSGWQSIVHLDDRTRYIAEWRSALAAGEPVEIEARIWTAQHDYRWLLVRNVPLRDSLGNIIKWYGTGIDIEDRKRAEEQLRLSEAYLAEAQRLTRTGSFGWHVATGELHWSEETYQIFGYDKAMKPSLEWIKRITHPDDMRIVQQILERAPIDGSAFDLEHRLLMPDGTVKHLHVVAHPMRDSSGTIELIGAVTDITAAKAAEEALSKAQADLAHANRVATMGELSASLAHEISQPITGAITNASTCLRCLKREFPGLDDAKEAASRMIRDANRAAEIISHIRLFFRKGTFKTEPVDLNELIREMVVLLRVEATQHSISVRTELAHNIPLIVGDQVQLQQVLMNLMINAIDAMKDVDGPRLLTLRSQQSESEQIVVLVEDTGVGLPPKQADQIFNAFFTTKKHGTGMGMGLRISRSIIEAHGGRLWATDNAPRGARFHFTLAGDPSPLSEFGVRVNQVIQ